MDHNIPPSISTARVPNGSDRPLPTDPTTPSPKYGECMRNHAATVGGLVVDGCGEFLPGETHSEALKCAVCGCHRSFHRRDETPPPLSHVHRTRPAPYYYHPYGANGSRRSSAPDGSRHMQPILALPPPRALKPAPIAAFANESSGGGATESSSEEMEPVTPVAAGWHVGAAVGHVGMEVMMRSVGSSRKRFRTKFTAEQKGRMMEFAGSMGWRMQRRDEGAVDRFCAEIGVPRKVFKVWMHNNKHASASAPVQQQQTGDADLQKPMGVGSPTPH